MIKIRPCKEPVNSFLEVVVCMIILVGVPVIIIHVHERILHNSKCLSSRSAKHEPFRRLVFQASLWTTAFSVIPNLKPEKSVCFYYYWNRNYEHYDYISFYLCSFHVCFPLCLLQSPGVSAFFKSIILSVFRRPGHFWSPVYSKPSWAAAATPV